MSGKKPSKRTPSRKQELQDMPYRKYLFTQEWRSKRQRVLARAGNRCQVCNSAQQPLNIHHRTYERRGREKLGDLLVLCRRCHETFHQKLRLSK